MRFTLAAGGVSVAAVLTLGCAAKAGGSPGSSSSGGDAGSSDSSCGDAPSAKSGSTLSAFDASCFTLAIDPDAAPDACGFTPADVACNTSADCATYADVAFCVCINPVYGVSSTSWVNSTSPAAHCVLPPPPVIQCGGDCPPDASGFETQDCRFAPTSKDVGVACINHQCFTYAAPGRCQ